MSIKIGFAILNYDEPNRLLRLVKTLNAMFGAPPIVCHHNFSQCPLQETAFPTNIRFVHPHINTGWGVITTPLAALKAFGLLREHDQPDWYFLLSGSDYPVRSAEEIIGDLSDSGNQYDAYLDNREILYRAIPPKKIATNGFRRSGWIPLAYDRYCVFRIGFPCPSIKLFLAGDFPFQRRHLRIKNHRVDYMTRRFQVNRPSRIYGGAFWFHANQKAIDRLLGPSLNKLVRYYRTRRVPEESLFHTALCNEADLRICDNYKRYEDWTSGGAHPKWLDVSDLPKIKLSGAYFARKIQDNSLLDLIDTTLLRVPRDRAVTDCLQDSPSPPIRKIPQ